jgi:methanogenic corrinoid protein MtbC1
MKPQPITDGTFSESEAMRMVQGLGVPQTHAKPKDQRRQAVLSRALEDEVIPRLLTANRLRELAALEENSGGITEEHIDALVQLVLQGEATAYVEALRAKGLPAHLLFLDLLAPAARKLGQLWEEDSCDFADVTLGVMRLRHVMRVLGAALESETVASPAAPRVLLFQAPGEQHGFGLAMVTQFFSAAGFRVRTEPAPASAELLALVAGEWFGLAGVSVACADHAPAVGQLLADMRRVSRNQRLGIMAGGNAFAMQPALGREIGADLTATDGLQAVNDARALLARLANEQ